MSLEQRITAELDSLLESASQLYLAESDGRVTITLKDHPGQWHYASSWIDPETKELCYPEVTPEQAARHILASALISVIEQRNNIPPHQKIPETILSV